MDTLRVYLFRSLRVTLGETRAVDLGSPTTRSLFAYLTLHRQAPIDRRKLAFTLWPRATESAARRNLRQYLHRLRRALEGHLPPDELLFTDGSTVALLPEVPLWVDVEAFALGTRPEASLAEVEEALLLYTGDLLADLYDEWCETPRQRWRGHYLESLERVAQAHLQSRNFPRALRYAHLWLESEPLDEAAHRTVMLAHLGLGQHHQAAQHYHHLCEVLDEELRAEPSAETQALYERIRDTEKGTIFHPPPPRRGAPPPAEIPLCGRTAELQKLEAAFAEASTGRGNFLLLTGEAGIGKTRLMQEALLRHASGTVLQTSANELEAITPYAPVRRLLAQAAPHLPPAVLHTPPPWLTLLAGMMPELRARLPYAQPSEAAASEGAALLLDALVTFFLQLQPAPVALVLDNLHWADSQTWDWLAGLAQRVPRYPILVFGLCRREDLSDERRRFLKTLQRNDLVEEILLPRLSRPETTELAGYLLPPDQRETTLLERLYQETEGNPFFVIETARALAEGSHPLGGQIRLEGEPVFSGLPPAIQRVIESRLDRLPPKSREWLSVAAAIGRETTFALLADVTQAEEEALIQALETWVQRGLMRETEAGYDFVHDKIRQVAYAGLSQARRQYVHRRIADALERVVPPVDVHTLAYHYARSDRPLLALPYLTRAGEQALQVRSYREARQFGLQAVRLLGKMPGPTRRQERIDLNLQLAQAYAFSGDMPRALEILRQTEGLAQQARDEARQGRVFRRMAQMLWLLGETGPAGDYARRALRVGEELQDPALLRAALRMLGRVGIAQSAFDDAIAYLVRYVNMTEAETLPPPDLPIVLGYLGVAYARVGSWQRGHDVAQRGVALAKRFAPLESGSFGSGQNIHVFALMQHAFVHAEYHDWNTCLRLLEETPDPLEQEGEFTPLGFMLLGLRGHALAQSGQPAEGLRRLIPAVQWAQRTKYRVFAYLPMMFLAHALLLDGQLGAARSQAEYALDVTRQAGNRWAAGVSARLLAEILSRQPHPDWMQVEALLIESMQTLREVRARPELARTYLALRRLYDRAGQMAWAVDCHFRATTIFEELGMSDELQAAQGQPGGERTGAAVILDMPLRGPNPVEDGS